MMLDVWNLMPISISPYGPDNISINIYRYMLIRIDLVFSYWVFAWYIAYITNQTNYNPKWALILGIVENIVMLIALIAFGASVSSIVLFLFVNILIKGVPLYTIYNTKTAVKDIYAIVCLFAIYTIWVYANQGTIVAYVQQVFDSILHEKNETPAMWLIAKIRTYLQI